jgi:formate-dependent nitrite reductase cytochrome c552 subunit
MGERSNLWILGLLAMTLASTVSGYHAGAQSVEDYVGPEACMSCHSVEYEVWRGSNHSQAFLDPEFQEEWAARGNSDDCLRCHTTGFESSSGDYAFEGVTCEACHGAGMAMEVDESPELCGSCHTGEYGNYKYEEFRNGTHSSSGVTCADCHMYDESHSFEIESGACATCHTDEDIHSRSVIGELQMRALDAEDRVSQIEEEHEGLVDQLSEMQKRAALVGQLTNLGAVALLLLGIVVVLLFMRQRGQS